VIWLAVAIAIAWLIIGSFAGPLSGKLSEVQKNDNASFLPASAESTVVANEQKRFSGNDQIPILIVVSRPDGSQLTPGDRSSIGGLLAKIPATVVGTSTVAAIDGHAPLLPIPSQDGKAVLISVPIPSALATAKLANGDLTLGAITESLRQLGTQLPGLQVNVTGPGGILSDLFKVFGGIDTTLLGVTALVVALILIFVYRSPFLWLIPLLASGMALSAASAIVYVLAKNNILVLNGQSQGILTVLVFGAGTDYALLLVARYREELHHHQLHTDAMKAALRGVVEPITASAATVCIGLLCLLLSELNSNRSIGPVSAAGILGALVVMLTFLPALLVIPSIVLPILAFLVPAIVGLLLHLAFGLSAAPLLIVGALAASVTVVAWIVFGILRIIKPTWGPFSREHFPPGRWAFWPRMPREGTADTRLTGVWAKLSGGIGRRPRLVWMATAAIMIVLACFSLTLKASGISTTAGFTNRPDSVIGQQVLTDHFPGGTGTPAVIIANASAVDAVTKAAQATPGIAAVAPGPAGIVGGKVLLNATLAVAADSPAAEDAIAALRANVHQVAGGDALVGGQTASQYDVDQATQHDLHVIIPVVLAVIFLILLLLLRAIVAPVILIASVVLSYLATLGVCALAFTHLFGFAGADTSFPLFAFVFLVALGVDYNIFLMTRVREESTKLGTRPGILRGLTVTGGVITSAGVVLAATFLVLGVLPLVFLREIGLAVAIGVILDTFIIRSLLVPAATYDAGKAIWWPSKLSKAQQPSATAPPGSPASTAGR